MDSELEISKQTQKNVISQENELTNNNLDEKQDSKIKLVWEELVAMIMLFTTFGLIPFIYILGIPLIVFWGTLTMFCVVLWKVSRK